MHLRHQRLWRAAAAHRCGPTDAEKFSGLPRRTSSASRRFSITLRFWNRLLRWNVRATPMRLIRFGAQPVMSCSLSKMRPELGWSWPPI